MWRKGNSRPTRTLAEYDQHARIEGGDPEQMLYAAETAHVALSAGGTDMPLMAADGATRRELSRGISKHPNERHDSHGYIPHHAPWNASERV